MLNNTTYYVELHGYKYFIQNNQWMEFDKKNNSNELFECVITDFNTNADFQQVRSPLKFSDIVLEKKLREEGSISGDNNLIVHYKNEIAPQSTDLFYTAVSLTDYNKYTKKTNAKNSDKLLFCFHNLLFLSLQENTRDKEENEVIAVIFIVDESIDIIVGSKFNVIAFEHLNAMSTDYVNLYDEDKDEETEVRNIQKIIEYIQRKNDVKITMIYGYTWLKNKKNDKWLLQVGDYLNLPIIEGRAVDIILNGEALKSSISPLFSLLKIEDSISSQNTKLLYKSYRAIPMLSLLLTLITIITGGYYFVLKNELQDLSKKNDIFKQHILQAEGSVKPSQQLDYHESLNLALKLESAKVKPSYAIILSELIAAMDDSNIISFEELTLEYPDNSSQIDGTVKIILNGEINKGFSHGVAFINSFIGKLRMTGYKLLDSKIDPKTTKTHFNIQLEK